MNSWQEIVEGLYGQAGVKVVADALVYGPEQVEAGYPLVVEPWVMNLIGTLATSIEEPQKPPPPLIPMTPIDVIYDPRLPWAKKPAWPFPTKLRPLEAITTLSVHHSGATDREFTSMIGWNAYHIGGKSWSHLGYHFCIASMKQGGEMNLWQTNSMPQVTWHDSFNYLSLGLVFAGDFREGEDGGPTPFQADLFGQFMAWLLPQTPNLFRVVPHNFFQGTACPGDWDHYLPMLDDACDRWGVDLVPLVNHRTRAVRPQGLLASAMSWRPKARILDELQKDV